MTPQQPTTDPEREQLEDFTPDDGALCNSCGFAEWRHKDPNFNCNRRGGYTPKPVVPGDGELKAVTDSIMVLDSQEHELEMVAQNIVHQIGDALYEALPPDVAYKYFVTEGKQEIDMAIDFVKKLICKYAASQATPLPVEQEELRRQFQAALEGNYPGTTATKQFLDDCMMFIASQATAAQERAVAEVEKAYGGCHDCYGKGYATVNDRWHGHDTDQDIGSPGGYVSGGNSNAMKFCTCDRGKQLEERLASLKKEEQ